MSYIDLDVWVPEQQVSVSIEPADYNLIQYEDVRMFLRMMVDGLVPDNNISVPRKCFCSACADDLVSKIQKAVAGDVLTKAVVEDDMDALLQQLEAS